MPTLVTSETERKNLRWDPRRRLFVGWRIDVRVSQGPGRAAKRHRVVYPSETEARSAENRLRARSENIRLGLEARTETELIELTELFARRLEEIPRKNDFLRAKRVFALFADINPDLRYVREAMPAHFNAYQLERERARRPVSPATINREMTHLITAFARARKLFRDLADYTPPKIERPRFRKNPRTGVIDEAAKTRIVRSILAETENERVKKPHVRAVIADIFEIGWMLGMRLGEIRSLTPADFSAERRTLRVVRWKTGTVSQLSYLPDRAVEILTKASDTAAQEGRSLLFQLDCSPLLMEKVLKRAIVAAGLPYGRNVPGGITFHSNRHSFTTRLVQVADLATAASFTGHASREMVAYYSHASDGSRKAAMARLYGNEDRLRSIWERTRSGALEFEAFAAEIRAESVAS